MRACGGGMDQARFAKLHLLTSVLLKLHFRRKIRFRRSAETACRYEQSRRINAVAMHLDIDDSRVPPRGVAACRGPSPPPASEARVWKLNASET